MKHKYVLSFLLLFATFHISAQLEKINPIAVAVNYYKTTHLIFPSHVKYFNSVGDFIAVDQPDNVPFILRIKANETEIPEETNVSVATADGKFYEFEVKYNKDLKYTNLHLKTMAHTLPQVISIDEVTKTHVLFPDAIKYVDIGDDSILSSLAENTRNVLWIKSKSEDFEPGESNISVVTEDDEFYTYDVKYSENSGASYYAIEKMSSQEEQVILPVNDFTDNERRRLKEKINQYDRYIYSLGEKKDGILFSVANVFIHKNMIMFRCEVENVSSIPYYIEYTKFNIVDRKKHKLTASQEIEQKPIFIEGYKAYIEPHKSNMFTIGFETFTIPDDKFLQIELNEKNGGRHVNFNVSNKDITGGQTF